MRYACLLAIVALAACKTASGENAAEKRVSTRQMRDEALKELYEKEPSVNTRPDRQNPAAARDGKGAGDGCREAGRRGEVGGSSRPGHRVTIAVRIDREGRIT